MKTMTDEFARRLAKFYQNSTGAQSVMSPLWAHVHKTYHRELHDALTSGDPGGVRAALGSLHRDKALHGIEEGVCMPESNAFVQAMTQILAVKLGIRPLFNPEQPVVIPAASLGEVEAALGCSLRLPETPGITGSGTGGILGRAFHYASYVATINALHRRPLAVLEIGGGVGLFPLLLAQGKIFGSYTSIDLPAGSVIAASVIASVFGENRVVLQGEGSYGDFTYLSATHYRSAGSRTFDLAFNSDSLPEIGKADQDGYIDFIAGALSPGGFFLSVNHESINEGQSSVLDAVKRSGKLRLVSRHPFTIRAGYIEEMYQSQRLQPRCIYL